MASSDQRNLSMFIKSVHSDLKEKSKCIGFEKAWTQHCQDEQTLTKYAHAMKELATDHWQINFSKSLKASSRVEWVHKYTLDYFYHKDCTELMKQRNRELQIAIEMKINIETSYFLHSHLLPSGTLKLLDVGSCYNPFAAYDIYEVLAVDIAPAHPTVKKMDFLDVEILSTPVKSSILTDFLECDIFDIIVFSLFLEYLPIPDLRLMSCEKAYKLLRHEGILFIITPDSKHVGANAKIMKSWRFVLAQIGFSRIKYEKLPHIHCMAYRKSLDSRITKRWAALNIHKQVYNNIFIPQDFLKKQETEKELINVEIKSNSNGFEFTSELPFENIQLDENDI